MSQEEQDNLFSYHFLKLILCCLVTQSSLKKFLNHFKEVNLTQTIDLDIGLEEAAFAGKEQNSVNHLKRFNMTQTISLEKVRPQRHEEAAT